MRYQTAPHPALLIITYKLNYATVIELHRFLLTHQNFRLNAMKLIAVSNTKLIEPYGTLSIVRENFSTGPSWI